MNKKIGAFGAGQFSLETLVGGSPGTTIFQNPGGGGGGWGGWDTRTGPGRPPRVVPSLETEETEILCRVTVLQCCMHSRENR